VRTMQDLQLQTDTRPTTPIFLNRAQHPEAWLREAIAVIEVVTPLS